MAVLHPGTFRLIEAQHVRVPPTQVDRHQPHARLHQPPREQHPLAPIGRAATVRRARIEAGHQSITLAHRRRLAVEVERVAGSRTAQNSPRLLIEAMQRSAKAPPAAVHDRLGSIEEAGPRSTTPRRPIGPAKARRRLDTRAAGELGRSKVRSVSGPIIPKGLDHVFKRGGAILLEAFFIDENKIEAHLALSLVDVVAPLF